jgi:hypothetical protein
MRHIRERFPFHYAACVACILLISRLVTENFSRHKLEKKNSDIKVPVRIVVVELAKRKLSYTIKF